MPQPSLPPPQWIQTDDELHRLCLRLAAEPHVAVDTESNSLHAYQERICLLQFSTRFEDFLVDPLSIRDLSPLAAVFGDPHVVKTFHAAEYDIMCLKRDFGFAMQGLFDTYIATRVVGWRRSGLASLLESVFHVKLQKRFQRADWSKRPLPPEMAQYAQLDTHYLLPLRDRLKQELERAGRQEEAQELFDLVCHSPAHPSGFDPQGFWRISDARRLSPQQAAILRELYLFREKQAQRLDKPPFKVLSDHVLLSIANSKPQDERSLEKIRGVSSRTVRRLGTRILSAVELGVQAPPPKRPSSRNVPDEVRDRFEQLRAWRKRTARQRKVESDVILPRDLVWQIAETHPQDLDALHEIMQPLEWRFQKYGEAILEVLT